MSYFSRSLIWWQRNDYDDFKKTGRIIAKAMLCGGSEIWLQTSNAWGKKQGKVKSSPTKEGTDEAYMKAVKQYGVVKKEKLEDEEKFEDVGSKWWCKFGHSRRGLEHIVTVQEGKQRQRFVNIAIRAVLDEQRHQRMTRKDSNKIASISLQYTSWARDLALAAAAADAEAVQSNFCSTAKCRIVHLKRNLSHGVGSSRNAVMTTTPRGHMTRDSNKSAASYAPSANFILSANSALTARVLDANTHTTLLMQRMKNSSTMEDKKEEMSMTPNVAKKAAGFQFLSGGESKV